MTSSNSSASSRMTGSRWSTMNLTSGSDSSRLSTAETASWPWPMTCPLTGSWERPQLHIGLICVQHPPLNILELVSQLKQENLMNPLLLEVEDYFLVIKHDLHRSPREWSHSWVLSSVLVSAEGNHSCWCSSLETLAEMLVENHLVSHCLVCIPIFETRKPQGKNCEGECSQLH